ncbi:hypothetical protein EV644_106228 [Kribbella orskensis]|uniref:Uncharacterized protein n=1 Tax=Kribbella orskensis TaxID=2512216 RepID=A0ABY2BMI0_9ACTN|nr:MULTISPECIES: hypothetical protein [Kribbella]TCN40300.1 hypothetical protein EV642_105228 [Kribbella sp. VKM Ac-2500]TCO22920.1 hypothetical protein EV644_106228 [Kribbella orskensis]
MTMEDHPVLPPVRMMAPPGCAFIAVNRSATSRLMTVVFRSAWARLVETITFGVLRQTGAKARS